MGTVSFQDRARSYGEELLLDPRHHTYPLQHCLLLALERFPGQMLAFPDGLKSFSLNLFLCCRHYKAEKKRAGTLSLEWLHDARRDRPSDCDERLRAPSTLILDSPGESRRVPLSWFGEWRVELSPPLLLESIGDLRERPLSETCNCLFALAASATLPPLPDLRLDLSTIGERRAVAGECLLRAQLPDLLALFDHFEFRPCDRDR
ncbi:hypothetical protein EMWEY_00013410 [Eimeria maxima]|uniref:Uncharacterized protein n=1 Tax=Eimeria maxima TaxID=5804 RepID=U6M6H2_EIMMA|nr:hypothetical protein EMWEY_00013410 [Eimeria maxima]CDJ58034.1 hypothetical protein EMWEY_00013410 [Eimeria maxima]